MSHRRLALCAALAAALAFPATASAQLPLPTDPIDDVLDDLPIVGDPSDPVEDVVDPVEDIVDPADDVVVPIDPGDDVVDPIGDLVGGTTSGGAGGTTSGGAGGAVVLQIAPTGNPHGALRVLGRRATLTGRTLRFRVACTASAQGCKGKAGGRPLRLRGGAVRKVDVRLTARRARAVQRARRARVVLVHTGHTARLTTVKVRCR